MSKDIELSWLQNVKVDVVKTLSPPRKPKVVKTPPDTVHIRVFADGRVFPSQSFADDCNLEYKPRVALDDTGKNWEIVGNGIDLWPSNGWKQIEGKLPEGMKLIFGCVTPKALAKVSLWDSTKYTEDNEPKASVLSQGAQTYGKNTLVPMLAEVYDIDWETTAMVDLKFADDRLPAVEGGVYHIPKVISTGKNKGQSTFVRRQDIDIYPLLVSEVHPVESKHLKQVDKVAKAKTEEIPAGAEDFAAQLGGDSANDIKVTDPEVVKGK